MLIGIVAAATALLVLIVVLASVRSSRRALRRRIDAASARLGVELAELNRRSRMEVALGRLEGAIDGAAAGLDAAREEMARATSALNAIPEGIVVCDDDGREVMRNEMSYELAGSGGDLVLEDAVQAALASAVVGTPLSRTVELPGDTHRIVVVSAIPIDDGIRPTGALAVINDITERRRLEGLRRDFVTDLTEQLTTPVHTLRVLAETICAEDDGAVRSRLAERMLRETTWFTRAFHDLVALSGLEAEQHPVREPVMVRVVVQQARDRVRDLLSERNISVVADDVDASHTVRGNPGQLVSALVHLLENACSWSRDGSTVWMSSRAQRNWVEIDVRDQGVGIPPEDAARVFERFYRVKREGGPEGAGLGLAIVRHIARNHRGEVRLASTVGEGATFTLRLPSGPGPVEVSDG